MKKTIYPLLILVNLLTSCGPYVPVYESTHIGTLITDYCNEVIAKGYEIHYFGESYMYTDNVNNYVAYIDWNILDENGFPSIGYEYKLPLSSGGSDAELESADNLFNRMYLLDFIANFGLPLCENDLNSRDFNTMGLIFLSNEGHYYFVGYSSYDYDAKVEGVRQALDWEVEEIENYLNTIENNIQ